MANRKSTPRLAVDHVSHGGVSQSDLSSNLGVGHPFAMETNHGFIPFSSRSGSGRVFISSGEAPHPLLRHHVAGVVLGGPEEQVVWPDASWDIAMVANPKPFGDWAYDQFVRETMSPDGPVVDRELSIPSTLGDRSGPEPTGVGLLDLLPEAFGRESCFHGMKYTESEGL